MDARRLLAVAMTLFLVASLAGCGAKPSAPAGGAEGAQPAQTPDSGPGPAVPLPAAGADASPAANPPIGPSGPPSPVTWTISSLDEPWMKAPITVRLMLPQHFRLTFSAPIDRPSVEKAVGLDMGPAYNTQATWLDDQTLDFTIGSGPTTERTTFLRLSPAGGLDRDGRVLQAAEPRHDPVFFQLSIGTASEVWRWTLGDKPRLVAALPGPFDVLSVSPDGTKLVLRRYGIESSSGWPPVGPPSGFAYIYDITTKRLQRLQGVSGWLSPQWLADGSLLISGGSPLTFMLVTPNGTQHVLASRQQAIGIVDYATSPDGRQVAVFVETSLLEAKGDLWLFDLPSGTRREFKDAFTPTRTPNDVAEVTALWSPDGSTLVFSDKAVPSQNGVQPLRLLALEPKSGNIRVVWSDARLPWSWAADSKHLFVSGVGVVSVPDGVATFKSPYWGGAFSPSGDRVLLWGDAQTEMLQVPSYESVGGTPPVYGDHAAWSPDGAHVVLTSVGSGWDVYTKDSQRLWYDQSVGTTSRAQPFWSPDGRFLVVPGIGIGDTADGRFHALQQDLGMPIGWNRSGALFLGPGYVGTDDYYVKPTQFGR